MTTTSHSIDTQLVHAGEPEERILGAVSLPIFQTAQFLYGGESDYHDLKYIRLNNMPNHEALHGKLATLEGAEAALVTASGMAAISTALLSVLKAGDHLLAQDTLYGGTHDLLRVDLPALGIDVDFVDGDDPDGWKARLRPNTRAFYVESMTNPLLQVADLKAVVSFAQKHGLVSMIDNTFPSPVNFRPPQHGFDLSLHSATKYLNGHSDLVAGAIIGRETLVHGARRKLNHLGGTLDPHACFLLHRGLKTLGLRVRQQCASALQIARLLESHPAVERVNYPGLESHPRHARARELFDGFSGMLSFELADGLEAVKRFMGGLTLPLQAPSLGGVETLVTRPATTSHLGMPRAERDKIGISESLVRLSVGIEATDDLVTDLGDALDAT